jgi:hypothetical protein
VRAGLQARVLLTAEGSSRRRLTVIVTGNRSYTAGGKAYQVPQTPTEPLLQIGG